VPVVRRLRCSSAAGFSSSLQGILLGWCWLTHCLGIEKAEVLEPGAVREHPGNCARLLVSKEKAVMLYSIAVILLILWLLGFVSGYTIGAFIHVLLVVAIVLFLVGLLRGRRVV
jgi:hypothetical protein